MLYGYNLKGACHKGQSYIHTPHLLQETVLSALEHHMRVFVAFYVFGTVRTEGSFSKMYVIGVTGTYIDFYCKVKIQERTSKCIIVIIVIIIINHDQLFYYH